MLPLIGAGFSLNARLPEGRAMPTWEGLGVELAPEVTYLGPRSDALETLSAYSAEHGRQALVTRVRRALHDGYAEPGSAHLALARLPFDVVATTNFDDLLETSYGRVRRPVHLVVREDQLALQHPRAAISLIKAHGDLNNEPVLIATEEDYDEFLMRRPLLATYLANLLITRVGLLIGYSFSDRNWRELLAAVRSRLGRGAQTVYAIAVDAGPVLTERFRRRGVNLIDVPSRGRSYEEALTATFEEMRNHIARHTLKNSTVRDEAALEELVASGPTESRLCLFLLPERRLAFYREQVFPHLRQAGVTPITPYDVDAPGSGLYATTIALLERVRAAIVDVSVEESGAIFEVGLALSTRARNRSALALVAEPGLARGFSGLEEIHVISEPLDHPGLPQRILTWAVEALGVREAPPATRSDPSGDKSDPNWQVVRAFRDLEMALHERYPHGAPALMDLLERAVGDRLLSPETAHLLREDYRVRNKVLHELHSASPQEANRITDHVSEVLKDLRPS